MADLRGSVAQAVRDFLGSRLTALGRAAAPDPSADLFQAGVLDSVALAGLITAVEQATGSEVDFIDVDPDALGTIDGIVNELTRVLEANTPG